jgi:hypothetical protein
MTMMSARLRSMSRPDRRSMSSPFKEWLASALARKHHAECAHHDLEVKKQAHVLDVFDVVLDDVVETKTTPALHLGKAGDARLISPLRTLKS